MPTNDQDGGPASGALAGDPTSGARGGGPGSLPGAEHSAVAAQLGDIDDALAAVPRLPVDAQVAVFTDLHRQLTEALAVTATAAGSADDRSPHRPGQPLPRGS